MPQFYFSGRVIIEGAQFTVTADTADQARSLATTGKMDTVNPDMGEVVDWVIDPATCEDDGEWVDDEEWGLVRRI